MTWILAVSFFNYGLLYIIAPWNVVSTIKASESLDTANYLTGIYTDFTSEWFNDMGSLIAGTTVTNMVFPIIEFAGFLLIRVLKRMVD